MFFQSQQGFLSTYFLNQSLSSIQGILRFLSVYPSPTKEINQDVMDTVLFSPNY